jgi:uncharacterized membrane protein YhhN
MFFLLFGFYNVWYVCGVLLFFTNHLAYNEKSLRRKYVFFPARLPVIMTTANVSHG